MYKYYISFYYNTFKRVKKYVKKIIIFKRSKAKYLEASEHKEYYSNYDEIVKNLSEAKSILYNKEEVKEYLLLERIL